jgi:hypothetical protein
MVELLVAVGVKEDTEAREMVLGTKDIACTREAQEPSVRCPRVAVEGTRANEDANAPKMFFSRVYQKANPSP